MTDLTAREILENTAVTILLLESREDGYRVTVPSSDLHTLSYLDSIIIHRVDVVKEGYRVHFRLIPPTQLSLWETPA